MPSHAGSYDEKGDPDNFLHIFEGAIRMQKWLMHAKFRSHFGLQKRFTKTHLAVHIIKQREGESVRAFATRSQIKEVVKSCQLPHLVKGIKKERAKTSNSQRGEKKEKSTTPTEARILMINQEEARARNSISENLNFKGREIMFPPVIKGNNSSAPVVIKANIFEREVGRVYMDSGSSCEVTIGDAPLSRSETLNFIIIRSSSLYKMLLGMTTMQKIGMVVSMIHGAVKFHTTKRIEIVFSTHESDKIDGVKKIRETSSTNTKGVLNCTDTEEKININTKYSEQSVTIAKRLHNTSKKVNREPFSMEHKLNEYSHIKPIKQKRQILGPDRSKVARKEVEELTRAGILREATHQTWVANLVTVKKSDEGWRMCVDFMDINKACPKTCYPLLEID
nr:hypothetical protein [Tanacetum cinerariifolium]